jgi:carboxymethylenebutenolidase
MTDPGKNLFLPETESKRPGVVVIHEYWGVNPQIQSIGQKWSSEGFVAVVPDLYHGAVAADAGEAKALMGKLDWAQAVKDIADCVELLRNHPRGTGKVAVTGYCMGGALSFLAAANIPGLSAVVPFYGVPPGADWTKVDAPIQAHFAKHDEWATVDAGKKIQKAVEEAGGKMELHVYDAQHAFCNDRRPEVYNEQAAKQAWARAVTFVREQTS